MVWMQRNSRHIVVVQSYHGSVVEHYAWIFHSYLKSSTSTLDGAVLKPKARSALALIKEIRKRENLALWDNVAIYLPR